MLAAAKPPVLGTFLVVVCIGSSLLGALTLRKLRWAAPRSTLAERQVDTSLVGNVTVVRVEDSFAPCESLEGKIASLSSEEEAARTTVVVLHLSRSYGCAGPSTVPFLHHPLVYAVIVSETCPFDAVESTFLPGQSQRALHVAQAQARRFPPPPSWQQWTSWRTLCSLDKGTTCSLRNLRSYFNLQQLRPLPSPSRVARGPWPPGGPRLFVDTPPDVEEASKPFTAELRHVAASDPRIREAESPQDADLVFAFPTSSPAVLNTTARLILCCMRPDPRPCHAALQRWGGTVWTTFSTQHFYRPGTDRAVPLLPKVQCAKPTRPRFLVLSFVGARYDFDHPGGARTSLLGLHDPARGNLVYTFCRGRTSFCPREYEEKERSAVRTALARHGLAFETTLAHSIFSLVPAGRQAASFRFAESLRCGAVPVHIVEAGAGGDAAAPLAHLIPWQHIGLFLREPWLTAIDDLLHRMAPEERRERQRLAALVADTFFASKRAVLKTLLDDLWT